MFNFDLKRAKIYRAVCYDNFPIFRFFPLLKKPFLIIFILASCVFLYGFLGNAFGKAFLARLLAVSEISLILFLICQIKESFFNSKFKNFTPRVQFQEVLADPAGFNLAEFLSVESARAASQSLDFIQSKNLPQANSSMLFYSLLSDNPKLNFLFSRALLDISEIKKSLEAQFQNYKSESSQVYPVNRKAPSSGAGINGVYAEDFQNTILESLKIAQNKGHQRIEAGDLLTALAKHDSVFQKILIDASLGSQDIDNLVWWQESLGKRILENDKWWEYENLLKRGSLAKEWTAGYTLTLDRFSIDLTALVKRAGYPDHIGHAKELGAAERILSRQENNNVLLVGEPGVGKKAIVQGLAVKSALGTSLPEINYKRIVILDLPGIISQSETPEEAGAIIDQIFQEIISAGNVILTVNDFHNFVGGPSRPGAIDITGILSAYLQSPKFQLIAITTFGGLHKEIETRPSVLALFEKVEVAEISEKETLMFLENLVFGLERKYKKFISYAALRDVVKFSSRYFAGAPFPKKAVDLLNELMVYVSTIKDRVVLPEHIARIVSEKTQIPVGNVEIKEKEILLNLENLIHQKIINQEEAVTEVASAMRRARAEVEAQKGPMGTFLFLGPTGVGKTETAKALAEIYFGSASKMIRLDMSEFQNVTDIPRLLGSSSEEGIFTTQVRENPFSLILLDELEKAHPNILNLFLQVLDEGHLTDGLGRKIDFKNSIIIATSNAGYEIILQALKEKTEWQTVKQKLLNSFFEKGTFRPEFINRFDAVVVFKPLTKENLLAIAALMLQKLQKGLKEKGIEFIITQPLKEKIVELSYDPTFGARQMQRVIQDKIENVLASALLAGMIKRGDRVEVDPAEFKLKINQ